jgi:hypothetical protein
MEMQSEEYNLGYDNDKNLFFQGIHIHMIEHLTLTISITTTTK